MRLGGYRGVKDSARLLCRVQKTRSDAQTHKSYLHSEQKWRKLNTQNALRTPSSTLKL